MSNPDKPAWLVPISRVVNHAVQPGTIYVNAGSQAEALEIARGLIEEDVNPAGVEWEPVSEIQDADWPLIDADLLETDVLPVNDTQPALRSRYPDVRVTLPRGAAEALMALATQYLKDVGVLVLDPADVAAAQHHLQLGLIADDTARALREPIAAEAGQ